jgi:hypothetical protein
MVARARIRLWLNIASLALGLAGGVLAAYPAERTTDADALVAQLRDLPPHIDPGPGSWICASPPAVCKRPELPTETKRREIYDRLYTLGPVGVSALARALKSPDVNLRRSATLALGALGGGWWFSGRDPSKVDTLIALPALIDSLSDSDTIVQGYAAQDLGDIGPEAMPAVPKLVALLSVQDQGVRNGACLGLMKIEPRAAKCRVW